MAGDFTGNGVLDLAVTDTYSDAVTVLLGDGDGGFQALPPIPLGNDVGEPVSIVAGEFTGDGALDLAVLDQSTNDVSILQGDGQGDFQALSPPIPLNVPLDTPRALAAGDFTGNGMLDLAVTSAGFSGLDHISIFLNEGDGVFDGLPPISLGMGLNPTSVIAAPLFGSGPLDMAVVDHDAGMVSLLQGNGQGEFTLNSTLELGSGVYAAVVTTGEFTGDGELDLAIGLQDPNSFVIELNLGNGQFAQPNSVGLVPRNTPVVADFTGDGVPDVAIVDGAGDILFRQGVPTQPGSFRPPITINTGFPSRDIAAVITNQGALLASVDETDNAVTWFAYISGQFRRMGTLATGLEPAQIVSADLNASEALTISITRNAGDGARSMINMGNLLDWSGRSRPLRSRSARGISNVAMADINQDGRLDILLANQISGTVEVIVNEGGERASALPTTTYAPALVFPRSSPGPTRRPTPFSARTERSALRPPRWRQPGLPPSWHSTPAPTLLGSCQAWETGGSPMLSRCRRPAPLWRLASPTSTAMATPTWRISARTG